MYIYRYRGNFQRELTRKRGCVKYRLYLFMVLHDLWARWILMRWEDKASSRTHEIPKPRNIWRQSSCGKTANRANTAYNVVSMSQTHLLSLLLSCFLASSPVSTFSVKSPYLEIGRFHCVKICLFLFPLCLALGGWAEHFNENHAMESTRFQA